MTGNTGAQGSTGNTGNTGSTLTAVSSQSSNYTAVLGDANTLIQMTGGGTFTIPPNSSVAFSVGTILNIEQAGASQVTIAGGSGVTVVSTGATASTPKTRVQYAGASAIQTTANNWVVFGDIV